MNKEYYIIKRTAKNIPCPYYMRHGGGVGAQFTGTLSDARQFSIEDAVSMKSTLSKSDKYKDSVDIFIVNITIKPVTVNINVTVED